MTCLLNVLGSVLAAVTLRDIFHTVWYPRGYGFLAHVLCRWVWGVTRLWNRTTHRSTELGGPLGLLTTVATWTASVTSHRPTTSCGSSCRSRRWPASSCSPPRSPGCCRSIPR